MIERCEDRQRKYNGFKNWRFYILIESIPVMLQVSLALLACGLCLQMWSINSTVACTLITLITIGGLFYLGIVAAGVSSYECPFQTPVSIALCSLWKTVVPILPPVIATGTTLYKHLAMPPVATALSHFWGDFLFMCKLFHVWFQCHSFHSHSPVLPVTQHTPPHPVVCLPHTTHLSVTPDTWLTPEALARIQKGNANDVQCVLWIFQNITDPEALNAAIRLASIILWFEDGPDAEHPYDQIVTIFNACFDSGGKVQPGLRDRAYHSAQAILWIRICAMCVSQGYGAKFPLPIGPCDVISLDDDLEDLLRICGGGDAPQIIYWLYEAFPTLSPGHLQWTSNALLHLFWANRSVPGAFDLVVKYHTRGGWGAISLNTMLNHLLVACILLDWPIEEQVLKVQDKVYVIPYLCPANCSHCHSPVDTQNRSYLGLTKH